MAKDLEAPPSQPEWYAIHTRSRHEKVVAEQLKQRDVDHFLPLYESLRKWKNGRFKIQLPLFPGYLFVRILLDARKLVVQVPGVVGLVGFKGVPAPLPHTEIETIRFALEKGVQAQPHPYLKVGSRVRIKAGPLAGLNGILARKKGQRRVVVSVDLIMRSIATDVDDSRSSLLLSWNNASHAGDDELFLILMNPDGSTHGSGSHGSTRNRFATSFVADLGSTTSTVKPAIAWDISSLQGKNAQIRSAQQ